MDMLRSPAHNVVHVRRSKVSRPLGPAAIFRRTARNYRQRGYRLLNAYMFLRLADNVQSARATMYLARPIAEVFPLAIKCTGRGNFEGGFWHLCPLHTYQAPPPSPWQGPILYLPQPKRDDCKAGSLEPSKIVWTSVCST